MVLAGFGWFHVLVTTLLVFNFNGKPEIICMTNILKKNVAKKVKAEQATFFL